MTPPLVSIIIPAYNAAAHIDRAIASALQQSVRALEVVVVDDASPDDTAARVGEWAERDARVRLVRASANGGPARARNLAIAAAQGAWIALLDSDDAYAPGRLERLLDVAHAQSAELVADNLRLVDAASGQQLGAAFPAGDETAPEVITADVFVRRNLFGHDGFDYGYLKPLIRRAFLERHAIRYREEVRIGEDYHLYLDCLLAGARFVLVPEALYDYYLVPGSISRRLPHSDAVRLARLNAELLAAAPNLAEGLVAALRERQRVLDALCGHIRFVDLIKAGAPHQALALLVRRPEVVPLVIRYGRESVLKRLGRLGFHGLRTSG